MLDRQTVRWIYLYTIAILFSAWAGYYSWPHRLDVSRITLASVPSTPPDEQWAMHLFTCPDKYLLSSKDIVLITERPGFTTPDKNEQQTRYMCARKADTWGEVTFRFPLDGSKRVQQAVLDTKLELFLDFDPQAAGQLWIASDKTADQWQLLVVLDSSKTDSSLTEPIDVTQWTNGASYLDVRYRVKAHRLMFHPTPNDPIGFAAAQCLRSLPSNLYSLRLRVWR